MTAAARRRFVNGKWLAQTPSGTQRYATEVMRAAADRGLAEDITLVLPSDAPVPAWAVGTPIVRSRLRGVLFEQIALPWISRRAHLYSLAGPAPVLKRHQTVVMHDATPFRYPATFRRSFVLWYRLMYRVLSRRAERLLTVSEFSRRELSDVLGVPEERIGVAPCGADHVGRSGEAVVEPPFPRGTYALLVGNLAPHKNLTAALAALSMAGVPTAVVGGVQPQVFREGGAGVADHGTVRVLGRLDDRELEALYAGAGVLVAASRYEGFGIPIVEAGRLGCPSVYATGSAMTEVAGDGGLGFDPDDMSGCVRLVRRVLGDAGLRAELATAARRNADRYDWRRTAQIILGPAAETLDRSPGAAASRATREPSEFGLRVLHVTESFAAGTGLAIIGFARGTQRQGVESFLLAQDRGGGLLEEVKDSSPFRTAKIIAPGLLRLWREIGPAVRATQPHIVHAHSSLAGAVVRLRLLGSTAAAVVYSPHCFAFERRDVSALHRHLYRLAEGILARWTAGYVCVSPHEAQLASRLRPDANVKYVINYIEPSRRPGTESGTGTSGALRLASVGRIVPQKDPTMFAEIVAAVRRRGEPVEAVWIGDGDDDAARRALTEAGVHVTGWMPSSRVLGMLPEHQYYVHTASWEAALPIAVLDAMSAGLPVLVRHGRAYAGLLPQEWLFHDVSGAVRMLDLLRDPARCRDRVHQQFLVLEALRRRGPDVVLTDSYRDIYESSRSRRLGRSAGPSRRGGRSAAPP